MDEARTGHRGSWVWPVILIAAGAVFLLSNLGLLGAGSWETLINLWPVLLLAIGLESLFQDRGITGPVLLIGVGSVFLLTNFGVLGQDVWWTLLRTWPAIFVLIGLDILIGRRSIWLSLAAVIVILTALGGILMSARAFGPTPPALSGDPIQQPIGEIDSGRVILRPAVASVRVRALKDSDQWVEGAAQPWRNETIRHRYSQTGAFGVLEVDSLTRNIPFVVGGTAHRNWTFELSPEIPVDLQTELGVGFIDLDLKDLQVSEVDLQTGVALSQVSLAPGEYSAFVQGGVGQTTVVLPESGDIRLQVESGVGGLLIQIPEGMAARITVDRGIAGLQLPPNYRKSGSTYVSPGYASAEHRATITINLGIGNIAIRTQ